MVVSDNGAELLKPEDIARNIVSIERNGERIWNKDSKEEQPTEEEQSTEDNGVLPKQEDDKQQGADGKDNSDDGSLTPPTTDELIEMARQGNELAQYQLEEQGISWEDTNDKKADDKNQSALARIPKDNDGSPIYEQTDADTAWDAIVEQTDGDEDMAQSVADSMVADKEKALHDVENAEIAQSGSVADKIAAAKQHKQNVDNAKAELEHWKEIAGTLERRKQSAEKPTEVSYTPPTNGNNVPQKKEDNNVPKQEDDTKPQTEEPTGQNDVEPQTEGSNVPQSDEEPITAQTDNKPADTSNDKSAHELTDNQGNPINQDGTLKLEQISSIDELTDEDFSHPTRNVELPTLPNNVADAIGANGKPVVIKKNIFEKNKRSHRDLTPEQGREILTEALYHPNLYGQNQKTSRPYNWILIHNAEKHSSVILEVSHNKDNVEIVNWHYLDDATLERKKRQAVREGGLILTLESAAANTHNDLSSTSEDTANSTELQGNEEESSATNDNSEQETAAPTTENADNALYTITPATYTNKKGKTSDVSLLTFNHELTTDQEKSVKEFAKERLGEGRFATARGWKDRESGGWIFRSEEDARKAAEMVSGKKTTAEQPKIEKPTESKPKETKQKNSGNRLVTDERYEELKKRMKGLLSQLNMGINPEMLAIGMEMAAYHIERGARKFADYAKNMINDLGDDIRPYLKAFYNGARDMPEVEEMGLSKEMTPYEEVKRFDVANFEREHVGIIEQAKQIANEQKVEEQAKKIKGEKTSEDKGDTPLSTKIATASTEVNTEPTEAQKEAGNYKKGHVQVGTFDITIEQPEGSVRKGTDANGKQWESKMHNTYGYFRGTEGVDGDHIDVFLSNYIDDWNGRKVYVVDQYNPDGTFDEHKVMLGFNDMDEAKSDYLANYEKGWEDGRRIVVSATNLEDFEKWIGSSHRKTKPFAEYAGVKKDVAQIEQAKAKADTTEIDKAIAKAEAEGNTELLKKLKAEKAFCEKHIPEKGDKKVGYKKQKDTLNITSIVNGKEVRAQLRGIHYENGFAVATDGYTMVITRQEYPTEYEGKTIGKNGEAIDLKFPIWVNAIPMLNSDEYSRSEFEDVLKDASKRYKEFKKKYKEEHPEAKTINVENEMVEYEIYHQILLDKESGINVTDANLLLNILEWCGEDARVFKFKGKYYTLVFIKSKGAYALMMTRIAEDRQESDTRLIGKAKPIAETTEETKQPILKKEEKPANANNKKKKTEASKPTDNKDKEAPQDKIDDVGEKIEGARKDALKKLAESIEQATEEALVAMPFSKAFKRPNLKKAVEDGVLREEDALFAQAVMSAYLSRKKPLMSKSRSSYERERSEKTIKVWAHHAYNGVEKLKKLFSLSPSERDTFMMEEMNRPAYDPKDVEKRKQDLMEWNPGKVFNGTCYPINAIRLWNDVYTQLGYEVGTEVPQLFSEVLPTTGYDSYVLVAANGTKFYPARSLNSYNAVVDEIVYQTKVANADADTDHPKETFKVIGSGEMKTKSSGKWYVVTQASLSAKPHKDIFSSKEEAEKFAKAYIKNDGKKVNKYRYASAPEEVREFDGYSEYAVVLRRKNIGKGTTTDFKLKHYNTADEARAAIDAEHDELNELANKELAKDKGSKSASTKKPICSIEVYTEDGKSWKYGIVLSDKYAPKKSALNTMPYYLAKDFNTRKEAQAYLEAHKEEIEAKAAEVDEARRNFKYFTANGKREGNDYRKGEDVTAEQFREQFGFRGVQFGNWTNQRDRQEAVNQAFDAFMDLSRILGVSPKALSLNGELGIAFGARGSGKALAHYEPSQVVINLTKTNGAGSLAHEWWHALDNYFARQGNVAMGFVTQSKNIEMRDELRQAFNTLIDHLEKSPYNQRSKQRGSSYWGTPIEETARMFEQWVNDQLAERGEKSPFLTDADPYIEERYAQMNYEMYKFFMGDKAMPYEEYKQTPQALNGLVYLTRDELQTFGKDLKHIFDTIQQKVDETTGKTLMYHKGDVVFPLNHVEATLRDVVIEHLRKNGFNVITDVRTGKRVIELAKGEARLSAKQKRALETATIADESTNNATAISSADGSKVQNNLETLAYNYKNRSNKTRGFITDLSKALNLEQHEASHYGTFETRDGSLVTIRVSNHNARVSFFDENEEDNGISIVISSRRNKGILNDGSAHVVEYFYPKQSIERSEIKPLVEVIKSISEALNSGKFEDTTGIAERQEVNADIDHVRFFRTSDGEAYGFTYGGDIYIDPSIASSETPIHEYAHLWASALRAENKKEWKNVVDLMKGTSVWDEVKRTYPELKTDDEIADEVLATYSGRRGAERLRKEMDKAMSEGTATEREAAVSALQRVKQAIEKFWHAVADFLHIHYTSAEQVADQVMKDLLDGVDPREFRKGDNGKVREQRVEDNLSPNKRVNIVEALDEHGFKNYAEAKEWAKENIARTYDSEETGGKGDIRISNTAIDKYLSQSAVDKSDSKDVHLAVLKVLPNVIRESVDAEQHADYKKGEDGVRSKENGINPNVTIHRLYGAVRLGDKVYRVKVTLKEDKTSKGPKVPHSYEATKIELLAGTLGNSENSLSPSTNNSITLANLLKGVEKSYTHETFFNEGNELLRDGEAKDDSNSNEFGNSKEEVSQSHERVTLPTAVQEQVEAMHLGGEVEVVADGSGFKGKKRKAKGFYNKQTGKITIILGNHTSAEDVMQTLMHEAVAHKGLRKLFGKDFDAFLDKVFAGAEKPIREKIVALAAKNGWNIRTATEEYLASLAEDKETFEKHGGFWEKVRNFFYEMAHKLFPKLVKIGDNEMRYELWRSYENLKNDSSLIAEAKDIAMQDKLKVGNYAEKQGNTFDEDAMLYREERERVDAKHDYEMAMKSASHKFVTAWADSMYSLKQLQDIICKNGNTQIADWENAYMAENRMSSINLAEMETYKKTFYKDMLDAIQSLMKGGVKYQDVVTYMYAKHGLERNKYIQDEEIGKLQQAFLDKYGEKPISRPNDFTSGIDRNDYASDDAYNKACQAAVDAAQKKYDEAEKKLNKKIAKIASSDYSGLSSLFKTNSGFKTAAQQYVSDFEKGRQISRSTHRHQFEFDC